MAERPPPVGVTGIAARGRRWADAARRWWAGRRFTVWLLAMAGGGLLLRLAVIALRPPCRSGAGGSACFTGENDARYYHSMGNLLGAGKWFRVDSAPEVWDTLGRTRPGALHPPLYSVYLGVVAWFGGTGVTPQRVASAFLGVATVVLVGLLARRLAGDRAGLMAAALAALYPNFWINDTVLMSESLYAPLIALFALVAYRFWDVPTFRRAVVVGVVIGLASLTRTEAPLLVLFVLVPLAVGSCQLDLRRRLGLLGAGAAAMVVVLVPWITFNMARFEDPVLLTTSAGTLLSFGSCDETFYGPLMGLQLECHSQRLPGALDESESDAVLRDAAVGYLGDHAGRVPLVAAARIGRTFDLWRPGSQVETDWWFNNRGRWASVAGLLAYYALLPAAVAGTVVLSRRRVPLSPLLGLVGLSAVIAGVGAADTRFRTAADVAVVVLAAVALEVGLRRLLPQTGRREGHHDAAPAVVGEPSAEAGAQPPLRTGGTGGRHDEPAQSAS